MKNSKIIITVLITIIILGVVGFTLNNKVLKSNDRMSYLEEELKSLENQIVELENEVEESEEKYKELEETQKEKEKAEEKEEIKETKIEIESNKETESKTTTESNSNKIDELISEKQSIIAKKKVSRDGREQKALGKRIGEIEREISNLKRK